MTKEERLKLMTRGLKTFPKHCLLACDILENLKKELESKDLFPIDDGCWPYHILIENAKGKFISLFCGGFRKTIDIQVLRKDGMADTRYEEASFSTPRGATNYLIKKCNPRR